ncbi:hypothetical protein [Mycoplasma todarodis]|uniref:hypothetical protein n=1 Tax=Mycoplasma todarodis TaxID=1937191 RepID=UPI003B3320D4
MEKGKFTNDIYVPIKKLEQMDSSISTYVKTYRTQFTSIISFDDMFAKMVETPELIKKRYAKNVEISNKLDIDVIDYDYITEIAKLLVAQRETPIKIPDDKKKYILSEFKEEGNDLTLVTNWLIKEIDNFFVKEKDVDLRRMIPELSKKDESFIKSYNERTKSYSIDDYIKHVSCSYETARSSLERLTELELFIKDKQGKRFVFKPTEKLENIMKGGI